MFLFKPLFDKNKYDVNHIHIQTYYTIMNAAVRIQKTLSTELGNRL